MFIEDPIGRDSFNQMQVQHNIDSLSRRALMRQDPTLSMLVGEIRDPETAERRFRRH
jgi:type II secretory ATPase GspE/PulE/Tfp pilus assembly ATPase PilB-like protein